MTNSADPVQKPTDLDLHCLLRQGMSCSAREGLKVVHKSQIIKLGGNILSHTLTYPCIHMRVVQKVLSLLGILGFIPSIF